MVGTVDHGDRVASNLPAGHLKAKSRSRERSSSKAAPEIEHGLWRLLSERINGGQAVLDEPAFNKQGWASPTACSNRRRPTDFDGPLSASSGGSIEVAGSHDGELENPSDKNLCYRLVDAQVTQRRPRAGGDAPAVSAIVTVLRGSAPRSRGWGFTRRCR